MVRTALHEAAEAGQVERVRQLSRLHPDWLAELDDYNGLMPLHYAAAVGQAQCVRALLEAGAPVNAPAAGLRRPSPLILASAFGGAECIRALLAAGTDVMAATSIGSTAMHVAADCATLRSLLEGAMERGLLPTALQARTNSGRTPFHEAACDGRTACMAALLASGSDITEVSTGSMFAGAATALHLAAWHGRTQAVQLIAALAPALVTARAGDDSTPLDVARELDLPDTVRCLEQPMPTAAALAVLAGVGPPALPLFAQLLASRWPLTPEEWELVPAACPGLGALLPRSVGESDEQATLLVRHLPHADCQRLRACALSLALGRDGQKQPLPRLPAEVTCHILALSAA